MNRKPSLPSQLRSGGSRLEIDLPPSAQFIAGDAAASARVFGKINIELDGGNDGFRSVRISSLTMLSEGVDIRGRTGKLFVKGVGQGTYIPRPISRRWMLQFEISATMMYRAMQSPEPPDTPVPLDKEHLQGHMEVEVVALDANGPGNKWGIGQGSLRLVTTRKVWGLVDEIVVDLNPSKDVHSPPFGVLMALADAAVDSRTLWLRPIVFKSEKIKTGETWDKQLEEARKIWGGCCINLESEPFTELPASSEVIEDSTYSLVIAAAARYFSNRHPEGRPRAIEVFINRGELTEGGGNSYLYWDGGALAFIIITDLAGVLGNDRLLAHELGHVLGGTHPNDEADGDLGLWVGEVDSVLQPSDSLSEKNPGFRPAHFCGLIRNENIMEGGGPCQLSEFRDTP
jgi:hypothetical protein